MAYKFMVINDSVINVSFIHKVVHLKDTSDYDVTIVYSTTPTSFDYFTFDSKE